MADAIRDRVTESVRERAGEILRETFSQNRGGYQPRGM